MSNDFKYFDYIIVGAGSSGCTLASRLSEIPDASVLLIEAGKKTHFFSKVPISFGLFIDKPKVNWRYFSFPEEGTANRNIPIPRGRMLGGSSAINGMVYVRGQRRDYDTWAQLGNQGWGWEEVSKIFLRLENFEFGDGSERGNDGPLYISSISDVNPLYEALFQSAEFLGYRRNNDYNGPNQEGISKIQATINRGKRMSAAHCYLKPAIHRQNLKIITEATIQEIILDKKKCIGVIYKKDNEKIKVRCNEEVVISAGAVASPQILELSGIGNPKYIKDQGIKVKHELLAVGENFQDHMMTRIQWKLKNYKVSYNNRARGINRFAEIFKYLHSGKGLFSLPAASIIAFLKTRTGLENPDIQIQFIPFSVESLKKRNFHDFPGMAAACYQVRPQSTGSIHINSPYIEHHPNIKFNFLSDPIDKSTLIKAFKITRSIVNAPPMDKYRDSEYSPGEVVRGDDEIENYLRETAETGFHPSGTCKMGSSINSVVDNNLKIHGIESLRVADASIFPTIPSGNTNAACIMVGEKASDLIKKSYRK